MVSVLTHFPSNWSQYIVLDDCHANLLQVSEVSQSSVLDPKLCPLYTAELFSIMESKLYGYADESTWSLLCHAVVRE